jgi:non-homologous end joining protein Ku
MASEWKSEQYTDQYHEALEKIIEEKIEHGGEEPSVSVKKKRLTNVVDLASVLQQIFSKHRLNRSQRILLIKRERRAGRRPRRTCRAIEGDCTSKPRCVTFSVSV